VVAYENQNLIVGFKMKFLCERLQKPDYREVVEEILLRVARVPVRLQCVEVTEGKPAEPNVSASTKKAMEMFNATLHKV
jgi:DNA polymerase-3 subunit gamma/tau